MANIFLPQASIYFLQKLIKFMVSGKDKSQVANICV